MARIVVDARISRSWSTGIGVYTTQLLRALARLAPQHRLLLLIAPEAPLPHLSGEGLIDERTVSHAIAGPAQHLLMPGLLRDLDADLLIVTHPACAPLWSPCPRFVFVHDLIPLALPHDYSLAKRLYYRTVIRSSLRGAARVLVDSESTKRDCERLLGLPAGRLRVVYGGVGDQYRPGEPRRNGSRPYVLYVGNKRPHKNVDRLIEAFALLLRDGDPGCDLVIAGRDEPGSVETDGSRLRAIADAGGLNGRVRILGEVADSDLPAYYRGASAFAYLSSYEGFGLPPLEAMACGTPVVALDATSLREVVGEGGMLLPDAEPAAVARALRSVLTNEELRRDLAERGLRQARKFTWQRTAQAVLQEIDAALEARPP
ncbi:MAG: glycosyltransferase family 1 protein [Dehalococcoidia bacterium]